MAVHDKQMGTAAANNFLGELGAMQISDSPSLSKSCGLSTYERDPENCLSVAVVRCRIG